MKRSFLGTVFIVTALFTPQSRAAMVTFDLTGGGATPSLSSSYTFNEGGISLLVTSATSGGPVLANQNFPGGIIALDFGIGSSSGLLDSTQIDGSGPDEMVTFIFSGAISYILESVTFDRVGGNDDFSLAVDGNTALANQDIPGGDGFAGFFDADSSTFIFSSVLTETQRTGTQFRFGVAGSNDDYKISSITITALAVPEPTGFAVWSLLGLLVIVAYRTRR